MSDQHRPQTGQVDKMADAFASCFHPSGYELDQRFGWMSEEEREELGRLAQEKLKEAFIEQYGKMYND